MDINGNDITVYGGNPQTDKLVTQEYLVHIVDSKDEANMMTIAEGAIAEDTKMAEKYGSPVVKIDFDEYCYLTEKKSDIKNGVDNPSDYFSKGKKNGVNDGEIKDGAYFKWPRPWDDVTYGFGYSNAFTDWRAIEGTYGVLDYNYNIYQIANNFSYVSQNDASGGILDVSYYKTSGEKESETGKTANAVKGKKGFFFWMNAASDPGIAAKLPIDQVCLGSVIHVSTWMMESSNPHAGERANLSFNFVAVSDKEERKTIHSFVTGYVQTSGEWYRVYYQFLPNYDKIKEMGEDPNFTIDHFEIELENNCKNSESADYAIDEISIYITRPTVEAKQLDMICDEEVESVDVKITMPFEPLLSSLGLQSSDENPSTTTGNTTSPTYSSPLLKTAPDKQYTIHYCFVDKEILDKNYRHKGYVEAFKMALLKYKYSATSSDDKDMTKKELFGTLTFNSKYSSNPEFVNPGYTLNAAYREGDGSSRDKKDLVFVTRPTNENYLRPGHKYIIGIIVDDGTQDLSKMSEDELAMAFDVMNGCSHTGEFTVKSANNINITNNGTWDAPEGPYCLGSTPTVDIDLNARDSETQKDFSIDKNAYFDWYAGTLENFRKEKMNDGTSLHVVLMKLRDMTGNGLSEKTPQELDSDGDPVLETVLESITTNEAFTDKMKEYLTGMTKRVAKDGRPLLVLSEQTYRFKPLVASVNDSVNVVTAIPIRLNKYTDDYLKGKHDAITASEAATRAEEGSGEEGNAEEGNTGEDNTGEGNAAESEPSDIGKYKLCLQPIEVRLRVSANAPGMFHGFDEIVYPKEIVDVPIRMGLRQIQQTWGAPGNDHSVAMTLRIPIKTVNAPTPLATGVTTNFIAQDIKENINGNKDYYLGEDGKRTETKPSSEPGSSTEPAKWLVGEPVYLIETDDPRYSNLSLAVASADGGTATVAEGDEAASGGNAASGNDDYHFEGEETYFPVVGQIVDIKADKEGTDNAFYVRFDGLLNNAASHHRYFDFKEGCYYTMKFAITETGDGNFATHACPGQHIFTIKVVPEYVKWAGEKHASGGSAADGKSLNWNNDKNWSRVSAADLFPDTQNDDPASPKKVLGYGGGVDAKGSAIYDHSNTAPGAASGPSDSSQPNLVNKFTTSGTPSYDDTKGYYINKRPEAFAPIREFTKVIIPTGVDFPRLYEITKTNGSAEGKADWSQLTSFTTDPTTGSETVEEVIPEADRNGAGAYTHNIHYDMIATPATKVTKTGDFTTGDASSGDTKPALTVRPWTANEAYHIHFMPDTEILGQKYLEYDKAWVEMEMKPDGWYTVS